MGCINSVPTKNTEDFDSVVTKTDASADSKMSVVMREKRA
ncbi:hypothetical protein Gpo141_00013216, partial [Globisporangium polare]